MNRHLFFVLLLTTLFALGGDRLAAQNAPGAEMQAKAQAAQAQTDQTPKPAEEAQPKQEGAPGPAVDTQAQKAQAQTPPEEVQATQGEGDAKLTSVPGGKALGMSILGNQEAPTSLVIVPWKTSELGRSPGIAPMLDDSRQPVDKEVFMRALRYYEIRSGAKPKP